MLKIFSKGKEYQIQLENLDMLSPKGKNWTFLLDWGTLAIKALRVMGSFLPLSWMLCTPKIYHCGWRSREIWRKTDFIPTFLMSLIQLATIVLSTKIYWRTKKIPYNNLFWAPSKMIWHISKKYRLHLGIWMNSLSPKYLWFGSSSKKCVHS